MNKTSSTYRCLAGIAAFVALVYAGDRLIGQLIDRAVMATQFRYSMLYNGDLPGQIVLLGNSRSLHMMHPPALNEVTQGEVISISFNALPTVLMPALWEDYLEHHQAPKKLLFEVSCANREDEPGALERFTAYLAHSKRLRRIMAEQRPSEFYASEISHLYRFNGEFTMRSMLFRKRNDQDWIMQETASEELIDRMLRIGVEETLYSDANVAAVAEVLAIAERYDVQVELIIGPFHPEYLRELTELQPWIAWFESQIGRQVKDYSGALTDPEAFADHLHLNPHGARMFADLLHEDGLLAIDDVR
ncbi:MAG: hypothetical protein R3C05_07600 [Pirellulaceae bacterium]